MGRKAQLWSLDFVMSLLIFMSAVLAVAFAWNYISANAAETQEMKELQYKVLALSDSLIRTPGIPAEWNETTVEVIGLAEDENVLNVTKVSHFISMSNTDYERARALLNMGPYEFYFEVADLNGTVIQNTTNPLSPAASMVIPAERYSLYNGRMAKVSLIIWG